MRYSIDQKILENLLNFVATKPFVEVAKLINAVSADMKPIPEVEENGSRQNPV